MAASARTMIDEEPPTPVAAGRMPAIAADSGHDRYARCAGHAAV
jgi:hypothetical protein